jgi:hypothetical protein
MARCLNCKQVFEVKKFNQKYCDNIDCKLVCALKNLEKIKAKESKEWKKRKRDIIKGMETVQDLLRITQKTFNSYIRLRDKGKPCISCLNDKPKKVNAGHYYSSGGHKNLTFNEDNCHLQCEYCNTFLHGNLISYRNNLINRIGIERLEQLDKEAHIVRKFTREELRELNEYYKQKLK